MVERGIVPDVVTDQTSAHDALNGYVPNGMSLEEAVALRGRDPDEYIETLDAIDGSSRGGDADSAEKRRDDI